MQTILDAATEAWGVKVQRVEMKDLRLPPQMRRIMAAEAEAGREAKAKVGGVCLASTFCLAVKQR